MRLGILLPGPSSRRPATALGALALILVLATSVAADPSTAGTAVAPAHSGDELGPAAFPDGQGGAFIGFKGPSTGQFFAILVDATGTPSPFWQPVGASGLEIDGNVRTQIASNQPGRVWLLSDSMDQFITYMARKVGEVGPTFPDSTLFSGAQLFTPALFALPDDRVLVAAAVGATFWFAIIEADGALTYLPSIGLPLHHQWVVTSPRKALPVATDGAGGAWVLGNVRGPSGTDDDFIAVRIASDGSPVLTPSHRVVCNAIRKQLDGVIAPDGSGGIYAAWTDRRDLTKSGDIFAQHVLADGSIAPGWLSQGRAIASFTGDQFMPSIVPDGAGGLWLAWIDSRSGENDLYYTRLGAGGVPAAGFPVGGRPLCAAAGSQVSVELVADGNGGFYAAWLDARDGEIDLYAQHIHATGVVMPGWITDGHPICTEPSVQGSPGLLVLSPGHVLATWNDTRQGSRKAYTALLPADGEVVGVPLLPRLALELRAGQDPARGAIDLVVSSGGADPVRVTLHDVAGRTLGERILEGPLHATPVRFDARGFGPGLYFARATRGATAATARVSLVR